MFPEGLAIARERVPDATFFLADARTFDAPKAYDVVGAFDVLEHIDDDAAAIGRLYVATAPGGGALITVPQHPALWSSRDEYACHVRRYRRRELIARLESAGFQIVRATSFVSLLLPLMALSVSAGSRAGVRCARRTAGLAVAQSGVAPRPRCRAAPDPVGRLVARRGVAPRGLCPATLTMWNQWLASPWLYDLLQRHLGAWEHTSRLLRAELAGAGGLRVLDAGAGSGAKASLVPSTARYLWLDPDPAKLCAFRRRYPGGTRDPWRRDAARRGRRACDDTLCIAVAHHLPPEALGDLFRVTRAGHSPAALVHRRREAPSRSSRAMWLIDRGHIRTPKPLLAGRSRRHSSSSMSNGTPGTTTTSSAGRSTRIARQYYKSVGWGPCCGIGDGRNKGERRRIRRIRLDSLSARLLYQDHDRKCTMIDGLLASPRRQ
jgi:SAM-dependent methyltransferase